MPNVMCRPGGQTYIRTILILCASYQCIFTCLLYADGKQRLPDDIVEVLCPLEVGAISLKSSQVGCKCSI